MRMSVVALTLLLATGTGLLVCETGISSAEAGSASGSKDCAAVAQAFADRFVGDKDAMTKLVEGGITGAVAGGAWLGSENGAYRGARTGAAKAYAGTMAQDPRVWQGLYDTAYQTCMAGKATTGAGSSVGTNELSTGTGATSQGCRSRAGVVGSSGGGTLSAGSGATGCR